MEHALGFPLYSYIAVLIHLGYMYRTTDATWYTVDWLCPSCCECVQGVANSLAVDCHGRQQLSRHVVAGQLDSLLSSNLTVGRLTSLNIVNTPLTHVPRSVCRLTTLTQLNLDHNRLSRLPDNCLTNLTALEWISVASNKIAELQDGLFDGLRRLHTVVLSMNQITKLGSNVFIGLTGLRYVKLNWNKLESLEPWPFIVGANGNATHPVNIFLSMNRISQFTNEIGWSYRCGMSSAHAYVNLDYNRISHFTDILSGWNVTDVEFLCLSPFVGVAASRTANVRIANNPVRCDCRDFFYYRLARAFPRHSQFTGVRCATPPPLAEYKVDSVVENLDQFVCEVTQECPPGCRCAHRPANATLHVYCSNSNLTVLPLELPALPKSYTKYKLDLSNNGLLRRLEHRDYFVNTSILDFTNCGVIEVDISVWEQLIGIRVVLLSRNKLMTLPKSIMELNVSVEQLALGSNPWQCSCDEVWLSTWLKSAKEHLHSPDTIMCESPPRLRGKSILMMDDGEFCVDPSETAANTAQRHALAVSLLSVFGGVAFLSCFGVIAYRMRVRLYSRWKFHPFDRDECAGEQMDFDVFLCCSSEDNQPYGLDVLYNLESRSYRVCYHLRDFLGGAVITESILLAIQTSRRTVCIVSPAFVRSQYCKYEFQLALHHNVVVKRSRRLVVLMTSDSPSDLLDDTDIDDAEFASALRQYLRQYTYIDYTADDWLDKLLYALPVRGLLQRNVQGDTNEDDAQLLRDIEPTTADTNHDDDVPMLQ